MFMPSVQSWKCGLNVQCLMCQCCKGTYKQFHVKIGCPVGNWVLKTFGQTQTDGEKGDFKAAITAGGPLWMPTQKKMWYLIVKKALQKFMLRYEVKFLVGVSQ